MLDLRSTLLDFSADRIRRVFCCRCCCSRVAIEFGGQHPGGMWLFFGTGVIVFFTHALFCFQWRISQLILSKTNNGIIAQVRDKRLKERIQKQALVEMIRNLCKKNLLVCRWCEDEEVKMAIQPIKL